MDVNALTCHYSFFLDELDLICLWYHFGLTSSPSVRQTVCFCLRLRGQVSINPPKKIAFTILIAAVMKVAR